MKTEGVVLGVRVDSLTVGESGTALTKVSGDPTVTQASGSMYIQPNAGTGHSGFRVYNTVDGAVETGYSL